MIRPGWKYLLVGGVLAVVLFGATPQADAQWWGCYRPVAWGCCYRPVYTTCYSSCYAVSCDPCCYTTGGWYLGWRPGPIRRLLFGRYRWYWGYGWSCCYPVYDCCVESPTVCGAAPPPAQPGPTPAKKPVVEPQPAPVQPAPSQAPEQPVAPPLPPQNELPGLNTPPNTTSADTSGVLTVWVPYDAKVTINGLQTKSTGSRRQFISYGLKPGFSYKYVIHAQLVRDGQLLEDTKTVTLTAGQVTAVAFGFNTTAEQVVSLP